jgi:hypothetical protein
MPGPDGLRSEHGITKDDQDNPHFLVLVIGKSLWGFE